MATDTNRLVGAVDVGGTKVAIGLVDLDGRVQYQKSIPTNLLTTPAMAVDAIAASLAECVAATNAGLMGIGIGCTGPVDPILGVVGKVALLPGWEGCALVKGLASRFNVSVAMENDADAAAMAEATWGSGRGVDRFLYITLSTGIGTGFVIDGKLYRGVDGSHPEMGHHGIDPTGPACYCGARGCWESLASGSAIQAWFGENEPSQKRSTPLGAKQIFDLYRQGDALAARAVERLSTYVGIGLANLTTILVPGTIALGGGLLQSSDVFLSSAIDVFRSRCLEVPAHKTIVRPAMLRNDVGLLGAAAVWMQRPPEVSLDLGQEVGQ